MKKTPVLLQLYSIMDDCQQDFFGSLEKVKALGYDGVEFSGYNAGLKASQIRKKFDELGLVCISGHVNFDLLCQDTAQQIEFYQELGCRYLAIPWLSKDSLPGGKDFPTVAQKIRTVGQALKSNSMTLLYHNHNFEFEKINGMYILDILYQTISDELLATELDTCWVKVGGVEPDEYIQKYAGRVPVLHLKDFVANKGFIGERLFDLLGDANDVNVQKTKEESGFDFRPIGHGQQDFVKIIESAQQAGTEWLVVEQDRSTERPAFEAARMSLEYLKSIGL